MKVLVTGATGFIGNHVINELLKYEYIEIIATSRDINKAKSFSWFNKVVFIPFNLSSTENEDLFTFFERPDVLIHLAWEGLPNYKSLIHIEKNLFNDFKFLSNIISNGLKNLTVTGTCFEYGMVNGCLNENMLSNPSNSYALAKDTLRKFIEELKHHHDFKFKWIRLFYMFGEGQSDKSLLSQLDSAIKNNEIEFNMSGGEQLRDYLHISEVVQNIVKIMKQNKIEGIINCCSGKPISIRNFVENYLKEKDTKIKLNLGYYPYPNYEPMAFWGDNKKMKKIKD